MPPKPVSIAYAGRKLTGPPEGYGKKKELQVKQWIKDLAPAEELETAEVASVTTLSELEASKEDLYRSLRDSTDGYGPVRPSSAGGRGAGRGLHASGSSRVIRPGSAAHPGPYPHPGVASKTKPDVALPPRHGGTAKPPPSPSPTGGFGGQAAGSWQAADGAGDLISPRGSGSVSLRPSQRPGSAGGMSAADPNREPNPGPRVPAADSTSGVAGGGGGGEGGGSRTGPRPSTQPSGGASVHEASGSGRAPPGGDAGGSFGGTGAGGGGVMASSRHAGGAMGAADGIDGLGLRPLSGGAAGTEDVELAFGILLARVEATLPEGAPPEELYRRALMMALEEQQIFRAQVRLELATVRAAAAEAKAEAQARAADLEVARRRAVEAEDELGRARAEALSFKQRAQQLQMEAEDNHEARDEALARAQAELAAAVAQLKEQSARANGAIDAASAEAAGARSEVVSLQRELAFLRRHHQQDMMKLEAKAASLQAALDTERATLVGVRAERDRLEASLQAESAARKAAEESERQALLAATKQTKTQEALQAAAAATDAARQRVVVAAQRAAAVRAADPAAAVVDGGGPAATPTAAAAAGGPSGSKTPPRSTPVRSPQIFGAAPATASPGQQRSPPETTQDSGGRKAAAGVEAARAEGHRELRRGLASERNQLGDMVVQQRRAAAAAQLADAKVVESALAAAPPHLRALGLAFRAYIVGSGGTARVGPPTRQQPAARGGAAASVADESGGGAVAAAALASRLSSVGYRVYVDPLTVQVNAQPLYEVPPAPLVGLSAAVVVLAEPGLLQKPLARGELFAAAVHGCPLVVLAPSGLSLDALSEGEEPPLVGPAAEAVQQLALVREALQEAWPTRIDITGDPAAPSVVATVAARLGLTDPQLVLLPLEALKPLAVSRIRSIPDLAHLNPRPVQPPALLQAAGASAGSGAPPPAAAGSGGSAATSLALGPAASAGLQQLSLSFQGPSGTSGADGGGAGGAGGSVEALVSVLCAVLRGNTSLTALTLRGCPAAAARTITEAVLASPVSRVSYITVSCRVPVAHLAGRLAAPANHPPPPVIDLGSSFAATSVGPGAASSGPGGGGRLADVVFGDEDAEVTAAALRARVAAAQAETGASSPDGAQEGLRPQVQVQPLVALSFPRSANRRLSGVGVGVLVEALTGLGSLQAVNGVGLEGAVAAARTTSSSGSAQGGRPAGHGSPGESGGAAGSGGDGRGRGLLNLSGTYCGPVVLALLLRRMQESMASLPALNLTGGEVGQVGAACLATAAAAAGGGGRGGGGNGGLAALHTACLGDNALGPEGVTAVMSALAGTATPPASGRGSAAGSRAPSVTSRGDGSDKGSLSPSPLRILDLSLNSIGDAGCKGLSRMLPAVGPSLRVLVLSDNGISTEGARALAGALEACTGLTELLLDGNQLGDQAVQDLAAALARLTAIQALHLQKNPRLGPDGLAGLAAVLPGLSSLQHLDLSGCLCGDQGARHVAKALSTHPSLTTVSLEACKVRAEGALHLATALSVTSSPTTTAGPASPSPLRHLGLASNLLGDRGAAALAGGLGRNCSLTSLDLRRNGVGLAGCRALEAALRERNGTLRALGMAGNEEDEDVLQALERLAASKRNVPTQNLSTPTASPSHVHAQGSRTRSGTAPPSGGPKQAAASLFQNPTVASSNHPRPILTRDRTGSQAPDPTAAAAAAAVPGGDGGGGKARSMLSAADAASIAMAAITLDVPAPLTAAEALLARIGALDGGLGQVTSGLAIGSSRRAQVGAADDEDLEELLKRYRTGKEGVEVHVPAGSAAPVSIGAKDGLLDLGYTGM